MSCKILSFLKIISTYIILSIDIQVFRSYRRIKGSRPCGACIVCSRHEMLGRLVTYHPIRSRKSKVLIKHMQERLQIDREYNIFASEENEQRGLSQTRINI